MTKKICVELQIPVLVKTGLTSRNCLLLTANRDANIYRNSRWCDTLYKHFELGRRPRQPAFPGKVDTRYADVAPSRATKRAGVGPLITGGLFVFWRQFYRSSRRSGQSGDRTPPSRRRILLRRSSYSSRADTREGRV